MDQSRQTDWAAEGGWLIPEGEPGMDPIIPPSIARSTDSTRQGMNQQGQNGDTRTIHESIAILQNLVEEEYTMRDTNVRCMFCGNKNILTIPETAGQHTETCEIGRAKKVLAQLASKQQKGQ